MMHNLSDNQLAEIRQHLQAERHQLLEDIRQQLHDADSVDKLDRYSQLKDPGDYSVADVIGDMRLEQLDRETEHLREVEHAEVRIERGEYGECVSCGTDINPERLMVQPTASRCIQCQEKYEREHPSHISNSL